MTLALYLVLILLVHRIFCFPGLGAHLSGDVVQHYNRQANPSPSFLVSGQPDVSPAPYTWSPSQLVDVTGEYAYQDPRPGQARGPCPAQNALANHGYLNRSGYMTLTACIAANVQVFNLGADFAFFLCFLGNFFGGSILFVDGFSIGNSSQWDKTVTANCGPSKGILGLITGLICNLSNILSSAFGTAEYGMAQTHNDFEGDSSLLAYDWGLYGLDASTVDLSQANLFWSQYRDAQGNFDDYTKLMDWANDRKNYCIGTNPCYLRVPPSSLASLGAHVFMRPMFCNNTPTGQTLTSDTMASWLGLNVDQHGVVTSKGFGKNQIPNNWYKSYVDYTIPYFLAGDFTSFVKRYPSLLDVGGNTYGVNTFTGLDIGNFTAGIINSQNLLQGDNFVCLYYRFIQLLFADKLSSPVVGELLTLGADAGSVIDAVFNKCMQNPQGVSTCVSNYEWKDPHAYTGYCAVQRQPGGIY